MVFRKGGRLAQNLVFMYGDINLEIVKKFNYLGIVFTPGGSFSEAQATLSGQALKAIFAMNRYLNNFVHLKPSHILDRFDKLISPISNYGSEVWGFAKQITLSVFIYSFAKKLLSVKQCTQNDFVYGELGRCSFQLTRYRNIIKYWLKILHCSERKYVRIIYNMLYNYCINFPNKVTWVKLLRDLLGNLGFMDVWLQQSVGDSVLFLNLVKRRLTDWNSRLNDSTRALFYRNFSFGYKTYLDFVSVGKLRFALSRLRLSSHHLEVETGRWARPNATLFEERRCTSCHSLEDEFHFVLECSRYNDLRTIYIPNHYRRRPNMFKLVELFKSESKKTQKNLSLYVFEAFKVREQFVFG